MVGHTHQPLVDECALGPVPDMSIYMAFEGDVEWLVYYLTGISGYLFTMELPTYLASKKRFPLRKVHFSRDGNKCTLHLTNCPMCVLFSDMAVGPVDPREILKGVEALLGKDGELRSLEGVPKVFRWVAPVYKNVNRPLSSVSPMYKRKHY